MKTISFQTLLFFTLLVLLTGVPISGTGPLAEAAWTSSKVQKKSAPDHDKRLAADIFFKKGNLFLDNHQFAEAVEQFEKAVQIDDAYAEAHSNLGYSYRKLGRYDKAVSHYKKAIELEPDLAQAHEYLGEAYAEMGEFTRAETHLKILRDLGSDETEELEQFIRVQKTK
ncbi:tetratricopeptide repeat protein [Desulforhopalus singaporensis]|uniref:Tetratricopeptide repeat-containing protein n=1 Tax=Desulforhopalus singaporensis TaxID=91360 RepID=A0A1H0SL48_9BACT|nr:tetratricopeptide repeat protein [Desulforhopalus singaporensis]SDP42464.1 Tetratricopeptide repeat-containing protein [Desulforhopalus singaporensis]